jgi:hypothetical protein
LCDDLDPVSFGVFHDCLVEPVAREARLADYLDTTAPQPLNGLINRRPAADGQRDVSIAQPAPGGDTSLREPWDISSIRAPLENKRK